MRFALLIGSLLVFRIALFGYFVLTEGNFMTFDSQPYLDLAANLNIHHVFSLSGQPPFAAHVWRTPGYPVFLALIQRMGFESLYWIVFFQELVYLLFAGIFYRYGKPLFGEKITRIGLVFLLLEPGGLAFTKLVMSEILFMPFLLGGILAIGYYVRGENWRHLLIAGLLMGLGALVRPAILFFPPVAAVTLLVFDFRVWRRWVHAGIFLLAFVMALSPWLVRNYLHYGQIYVTGQSSNGLAYFHVPIVLGSAEGLSFDQGWDYVERRVNEESAVQAAALGRPLSPLEVHNVERQVAVAELLKYPQAYLTRWLVGIARCMTSPLIIELYEAFNIRADDRLQLLEVLSGAENYFSGALYYLQYQDRLYLLDVIFSLFLAGFALLGALRIINSKDCFLWIMMLANFYFISVPGPMSHGRFRVPVEIFWFIQAYMGFIWLLHLLPRYRQAGNR